MPRGISLHIGLNKLSLAHYGPQQDLAGCENDAKDMLAIAKKKGFKKSKILLTRKATAQAVLDYMSEAADALKPGDIFFLTYSGHGSQVPDENGDENEDDLDETWCTYDRMLVDDELYEQFGNFAAGVRVLMLSDSCHSGTVSRAMIVPLGAGPSRPMPLRQPVRDPDVRLNRLLPKANQKRAFEEHRALYGKIQKEHRSTGSAAVAASVILISGCQDRQESLDGDRNGLFTETLLKNYKGGKFKGGYRKLHKAILRTMPREQTPNFFTTGVPNVLFERQSPFAI